MYKWIGKNGWIHGVPARDLSDEEAKKHGIKRLLESGLYIEVKTSEVTNGYQGIKKTTVRG